MFFAKFSAAAIASAINFTSASSEPIAKEYQALIACAEVEAGTERLACFDQETARLKTATQSGEIIIMPRARVEQTRRALFGFNAPNIPDMISGGSALESIETTLISASRGDGWTFHLADGSIWRQVDTTALNFRPREGMPVRIRRAAIGSYLLKVGDSPAVRARRQ